jgi:hypothetical protein
VTDLAVVAERHEQARRDAVLLGAAGDEIVTRAGVGDHQRAARLKHPRGAGLAVLVEAQVLVGLGVAGA